MKSKQTFKTVIKVKSGQAAMLTIQDHFYLTTGENLGKEIVFACTSPYSFNSAFARQLPEEEFDVFFSNFLANEKKSDLPHFTEHGIKMFMTGGDKSQESKEYAESLLKIVKDRLKEKKIGGYFEFKKICEEPHYDFVSMSFFRDFNEGSCITEFDDDVRIINLQEAALTLKVLGDSSSINSTGSTLEIE